METTSPQVDADEPNPWTTDPTLGHATHMLRTMSTFLAMAADDAERAEPFSPTRSWSGSRRRSLRSSAPSEAS